MERTELQHINILVKDIDVSWPFYRDLLKFSFVEYLGERKIAAAFRGFDFYIEEIENWTAPDERMHIGLRCDRDSVYRWADYLREQNVPLTQGNNPTAEVYEEPGTNRVALYFQDPDGMTIEIYSPE